MTDSFFSLEALNIEDSSAEVVSTESAETVEVETKVGEVEEAEPAAGSTEDRKDVKTDEDRSELLDVDKAQRTAKDGDFSETLNPFAKFLEEKGFINLKDKDGNPIEVKDFDSLGEVLKNSIEGSRYGDLNDSQARYLEALEQGIPLNEFEKTEKLIRGLEAITPEVLTSNVQTRFNILYEDQVSKGQTPDMANKIANILIKESDSVETALSIVNSVKSKHLDTYNEMIEASKKSNKIQAETIVNSLKSKNEVIGIELTDVMKTKIQNNILNRAGQNDKGEALNAFDNWRYQNKEEADIILNALMIYTDGFKNLNKVKNNVKSSAVEEMEAVLKSPKFKPDEKTIEVNGEYLRLI